MSKTSSQHSDRYGEFIESPFGNFLADKVGLPKPEKLKSEAKRS